MKVLDVVITWVELIDKSWPSWLQFVACVPTAPSCSLLVTETHLHAPLRSGWLDMGAEMYLVGHWFAPASSPSLHSSIGHLTCIAIHHCTLFNWQINTIMLEGEGGWLSTPGFVWSRFYHISKITIWSITVYQVVEINWPVEIIDVRIYQIKYWYR